MRVARLRPGPYAKYWSRLPARHLSILSHSSYAVLVPLLPSNSMYAPGGVMFETLGHSSNQFSPRHTGPTWSPQGTPRWSLGCAQAGLPRQLSTGVVVSDSRRQKANCDAVLWLTVTCELHTCWCALQFEEKPVHIMAFCSFPGGMGSQTEGGVQ